jgi:hypothetical protein
MRVKRAPIPLAIQFGADALIPPASEESHADGPTLSASCKFSIALAKIPNNFAAFHAICASFRCAKICQK